MSNALTLEAPASGDESALAFPRLSAADEQRLAQAFSAHFAAVWRLARRMGLPSGQAEEVAQESFVIAARKLHQIANGRERAYLYGTALRLASNLRRSATARLEVLECESPPEQAAGSSRPDALLEHKHRRATLDRLLDGMPEAFREVLVLFEIEQCSLAEIADVLGIPEGTAASRLRRAREDFARRVRRLHAQNGELP
jgi:RNA polymerase sigma-70 factor (ECF subfamily)